MWAEIDLKSKTVKRVINGRRGNFCLPVIDNSTYPTDPDIFKTTPEYRYVVNVSTWLDEVEDKPNWRFAEGDYVEQIARQDVLPLTQCKEQVYKMLAAKRWEMEVAGLDYNGVIIPTDRETSLIIGALPEAPISSFKIANGVWVTSFSTEQVVALKQAHRAFIQAAFDWEQEQTVLVKAMGYTELVEYVSNL